MALYEGVLLFGKREIVVVKNVLKIQYSWNLTIQIWVPDVVLLGMTSLRLQNIFNKLSYSFVLP